MTLCWCSDRSLLIRASLVVSCWRSTPELESKMKCFNCSQYCFRRSWNKSMSVQSCNSWDASCLHWANNKQHPKKMFFYLLVDFFVVTSEYTSVTINSSILWNLIMVQAQFRFNGRRIDMTNLFMPDDLFRCLEPPLCHLELSCSDLRYNLWVASEYLDMRK